MCLLFEDRVKGEKWGGTKRDLEKSSDAYTTHQGFILLACSSFGIGSSDIALAWRCINRGV